jgi:hypothetical protein
MSKRRCLLWVVLGICIAVALVFLAFFLASRYVPRFYRKSLDADPEKQAAAGKRLLQQITALDAAIQQDLSWQSVLTEDEVNGWLACDLAASFPQALPAVFRNPRVTIDKHGVTIAGLCEQSCFWTVVNLTFEPYMVKPNVLAIKILHARAGLAPVPMKPILDELSKAARQMQLHIEWRQSNGDPVALLSMPAGQKTRRAVRIESVTLDQGKISISGDASRKAGNAPAR